MARMLLLISLVIVSSVAHRTHASVLDLPPEASIRIEGLAQNDLFGQSINMLGDYNGDGIKDLVIASPNADLPGLPNAGEVYVVYGGDHIRDGIDLTSLRGSNGGDGTIGTIISGEVAQLFAGQGLGHGDLNNDGIDDLIISSPVGFFSFRSGTTYIIFGSRSGLPLDFSLSQIRTPDGSQSGFGTIMDGVQFNSLLGSSIAPLDDFNGDGLSDIFIGPKPDDIRPRTQSLILYGKNSRDAFPAVFSSSLTRSSQQGGQIGQFILGSRAGDSDGAASVPLGDINGDGLSDLLLGAPTAATGRGLIQILLGRPGYNGDIALNDLGLSISQVRITGASDDLNFGESIAHLDDFNGDGHPDYAIGSPDGANGDGRAYVVFGRPSNNLLSGEHIIQSLVDNGSALRIQGSAGERLGLSVAASRDLDGDGLSDLIVGAHTPATNSRYYIVRGRDISGPRNVAGVGELLEGAALDDATGSTVAGDGDLDGDGSTDYAVAAPFHDGVAGNSGRVYVAFGSGEDAAPRMVGELSHAWYDRTTPGQGVLTELGTLNGTPALFAAWYTFDNGSPLWLTTSLVHFDAATRTIETELFATRGGGFGAQFDPSGVQTTRWGTVRITMSQCGRLVWDYSRDDNGQSGRLILTPALADLLVQDLCTEDKTATSDTASRQARGLVGTLWNPARSGEGVMIDIEHRGATPTLFFSWFTFRPNGDPVWLVGSGPIDLASGEALAIEVFEASGARFGENFDPDDVILRSWGRVDLLMPDCATATLRYDGSFADGEDHVGTIETVRFTEGLNEFACR